MTAEIQNPLMCSKCSHINAADATQCAQCGADLISTIPVPSPTSEPPPRTTLPVPDLGQTKPQKKAVVFAIAGYNEPVFLRRRDEIILGRHVQSDSPPTLDLTQFNGHLLGVSRRHAAIRFSDDDCTVEDLGSANGTWVNENTLPPGERRSLNAGDQIRLGNLIMFVYFSTVDAVSLIDKDAPSDVPLPLTPRYLMDKLLPFLQAVADLQTTVDQVRGRAPSAMTIGALNASSRELVNLKLSGASDALDLLQSEIAPWKQRHADLIAEVKAAPDSDADADHSVRFENAQRLLIQSIVNKIAPQANSETNSYASKFMASVRVLALSSLDMSGSRTPRVASEQSE